jgi:hypothetical protein
VRHSSDGIVDRRAVAALSSLAIKEGFDGDVNIAVDRSTAHAVVHGSIDLGASIVVVETSLDTGDSPFGIGNWEEAIASTLPVPLVLVNGAGTDIKRVVLAPDGTDGVGPAAVAFVAKLAGIIGQGTVLEVDHGDPDWITRMQPGDIAFVAVPTFALMMGLAAPPPGAALAAVPAATVAGGMSPDGTP